MTKTELENWHENHENFNNMEIDINDSDTSDIIVWGDDCIYTNYRTGKRDRELVNVVRDDHLFILYDSDDPFDYGLYVKHDKEHEMLIVVCCKIVIHEGTKTAYWDEIARGYFSFEFGCYGKLKDSFYPNIKVIDICGHTPSAALMDYGFENHPVGAKRETISYLGGLAYFSLGSKYATYFNDCSDYCDIFHGCFDYLGPLLIDASVKRGLVGGKIPEEAVKTMDKIAKQWLSEDVYTVIKNNDDLNDYEIKFAIIQNIDGKMVERVFFPIVYFAPYFFNSEVVWVEQTNIVLDDACKNADRNIKERMHAYPIWLDENVKGTVLEYSFHIIKDAMSVADSEFEHLKNCIEPQTISWIVEKINKIVDMQVGYDANISVAVAMEIGAHSVLEKLYKFCHEKINWSNRGSSFNAFSEIMRILGSYLFKDIENSIFGKINESESKLHMALGISKNFLEKAICEDKVRVIGLVKKSFSASAESLDYLARMNNDDLSVFWKLFNMRSGPNFWHGASKTAETLLILNDMYGYKNWKSYAEFLMNLTSDDYEGNYGYHTYIKLVHDLPENVTKNCEWKICGLEMKKKTKFLAEAKEEIESDIYAEHFEKQYSIWEKWLFEDDLLKIVFPKKPIDIIREGMTLKHCAKTFVEPVAHGETIILFIRKKENPDKPYFTLEIKDEKVRQCHGFDNVTVVRYDDVKLFLKRFCADKKIPFNLGEELYRA